MSSGNPGRGRCLTMSQCICTGNRFRNRRIEEVMVGDFTIREATGADMPGIARVRTSVRENLLTSEQLAERGGEIVAFSMADREWIAIRAVRVARVRGTRPRQRSIGPGP